RRSRYEPAQLSRPLVLTERHLQILLLIGGSGVTTAKLVANELSLHANTTARALRALLDSGCLRVLPLPRIALADPYTPNAAAMAYGSGPNVYVLAPNGNKALKRAGLIEQCLPLAQIGPRQCSHVAHELEIVQARLSFRRLARSLGTMES